DWIDRGPCAVSRATPDRERHGRVWLESGAARVVANDVVGNRDVVVARADSLGGQWAGVGDSGGAAAFFPPFAGLPLSSPPFFPPFARLAAGSGGFFSRSSSGRNRPSYL